LNTSQKYKIIDEKWCFCQNSSIKGLDNIHNYRFEFFGVVHGYMDCWAQGTKYFNAQR